MARRVAGRLTVNGVLLREPILLSGASSEEQQIVGVSGRVSIVRSTRHRSLDIALECSPLYSSGSNGPSQTSLFELGMSGT